MPPPVIPPEQAFAAYGAQKVPLLQNITAIAGTGANCLQALSTEQMTIPYMVGVYINGRLQFWMARGGIDATDVPNGICQAGDWAQSGVVWYQSQL